MLYSYAIETLWVFLFVKLRRKKFIFSLLKRRIITVLAGEGQKLGLRILLGTEPIELSAPCLARLIQHRGQIPAPPRAHPTLPSASAASLLVLSAPLSKLPILQHTEPTYPGAGEARRQAPGIAQVGRAAEI